MPTSPTASAAASRFHLAPGSSLHILSFVYFTFISYLSIGLPLAVLPPYVHYHMGYSAAFAGLVISIQYVATLASRPWVGRIADRRGAKVAVLWGMIVCALSGAVLVAAACAHSILWLSIALLILSRLVLGFGESLGSTGSTLWGITSAGSQHTARVISFNGIASYGAMAVGAPLGVVIDSFFGDRASGLVALGLLTMFLGLISFFFAVAKRPVPVVAGKHLPFRDVAFRVAPHGMALALGGVGSSVLATFVTLFYMHRHWSGAALCLSAFGLAFVAARVIFIHAIDRYGGFPVAHACLIVESLGLIILWLAPTPAMALAGASLAGFGFSLVFPAIGVEAVKRVSADNRGSALGVFTAFCDVSFFLTGPLAGLVIGFYGYSSIFLFGLICVLIALAIVATLQHQNKP